MSAFSKLIDNYMHLIPSKSNNKYVFEINRNNKMHVNISIYRHQTLADLHKNIRQVLFPVNLQSIEMIELKAHSHERYNTISEVKNYIYDSYIRDIFLFNTKTNKILSIPIDDKMTLIEFIDANQEYFTAIYFKPLPEIYKLYVIDNEYLANKTMRV